MNNLFTENNLFKIKLLRNILMVSLSVVMVLALYNVFFIYPSFTDLLIESTKDDAVRATRHLATVLFEGQSELTHDSFNLQFLQEIEKIKRDFELMKLHIYSKEGKSLYSTDPEDIALINKKAYFRDIVAKGNVYAKVVPEDTKSAEGRNVTADVVETYVPLMKGDAFLGAFEIYYDITQRKKHLNKLLFRSNAVLFGLTISLLLAIVVLFFKENKNVAERNRSGAALRKSEEKLAGILNSIPDMIIMLDKDLNITWSNHFAVELLGSDPIGKKCFEALNIGNRMCDHGKVQKCFETGIGDEHELELTRPDGSRIDFWCTVNVATRSKGGLPKSVIIVYRDITEKKLLETETARACQLASIGELAAGVAHEINNPINGIINCAQMLIDDGESSGEQTEISQRILIAAGRIAMIVRNLLSFSRNHEQDPQLTHIQSILSDSLDLTETQIRNDGIDLAVDLPKSIPMVKVCGNQIQQVFLNIISNARYALNQKFSHVHDNKILDVSGDTVDVNGQKYVRVIFFDRGTGIPPDILDRICDPFFSNKPPGEGTGLGLSISQSIIKKHGGKLYFESVDGKYTKVVIELPAVIEAYGEQIL